MFYNEQKSHFDINDISMKANYVIIKQIFNIYDTSLVGYATLAKKQAKLMEMDKRSSRNRVLLRVLQKLKMAALRNQVLSDLLYVRCAQTGKTAGKKSFVVRRGALISRVYFSWSFCDIGILLTY